MDLLYVLPFLISLIGFSTASEQCYKKEIDWVKYDVTGDTGFRYRISTSTTCYGTDYCCTGYCCANYVYDDTYYTYYTYYEIGGGSIAGISFGCILGFSFFFAILRVFCARGRARPARRTIIRGRANIAVIQTASSTTSNAGLTNPVYTEYSPPPAYSEPPPAYTDVMAAGVVLQPPMEQELPKTQSVGFEGLQNAQQQAATPIPRDVGPAGFQNEAQQPSYTTTSAAPLTYPQS